MTELATMEKTASLQDPMIRSDWRRRELKNGEEGAEGKEEENEITFNQNRELLVPRILDLLDPSTLPGAR